MIWADNLKTLVNPQRGFISSKDNNGNQDQAQYQGKEIFPTE